MQGLSSILHVGVPLPARLMWKGVQVSAEWSAQA